MSARPQSVDGEQLTSPPSRGTSLGLALRGADSERRIGTEGGGRGGEREGGKIRTTSADFANSEQKLPRACARVCSSFPPLTLFCSHAHATHYHFGNRLREPNRAPPPPGTRPPPSTHTSCEETPFLPLHVKQHGNERSRSFVLVALAESDPLMEPLTILGRRFVILGDANLSFVAAKVLVA